MNEKIRELAKEHGFVHDFMTVGEYNDALQKFEKIAELIVREVFAKIEDERFEVYQPVKESVMKHFGVGE